jgi:AcrR family transcriptional regulator
MAERRQPQPFRKGSQMSRRGDLSRQRILEAALEVLNANGVDRITMRAVADRLGATPMALYNHVQSKADLLAGVATLVLESVDIPGPEVEPWDERLFVLCRSLRDSLRDHPQAEALLSHIPVSPRGLDMIEAGIACFQSAGFGLLDAARAHAQIQSYTAGYIYLELTGFSPGGGLLGRVDDSDLSADAHPNIQELEHAAHSWDDDAEFRRGFDVVVAGILATHPEPTAPQPTRGRKSPLRSRGASRTP